MLLTRIITSLVGAPILLYLIYRGGVSILGVTVILTLIGLHELFAMAGALGVRAWRISGYVAALSLTVGAFVHHGEDLPLVLVLWLMYCLTYFVFKYPNVSLAELAFNFLAISYVGFLFAHIVLLRNLSQGMYLTFLTVGVTWATDIGAFFSGKTLGKHKLAPQISPNKTVEGAVGGLLFAVLTAVIIGYLAPNQSLTVTFMGVLGLAVGFTGQIGDLVESAIKRFAGIKDSGKIIPGHGGVLDRFDSILFTIPIAYYLFLVIIIR